MVQPQVRIGAELGAVDGADCTPWVVQTRTS